MERSLLTILSILVCIELSLCLSHQKEWIEWKSTYQKKYVNEKEESRRYKIWEYNLQYIDDHNSLGESYTLKMNEFADLTSNEFASIYNGYGNLRHKKYAMTFEDNAPYYKAPTGAQYSDLPRSMDWRVKNVTTPVKNQGKCGSCWSFSATGALEGQHAIKTGQLVSLSEQQLIDCSGSYGNHGCLGGLMNAAFTYIKDNNGEDSEESYPYKAENGTCQFNPNNVVATDDGYVKIPQADEQLLMDAVYRIGPIAVAMDASMNDFRFYHSGVYINYGCSPIALDHGVLVVGYGEWKGIPYWLVKNSWGPSWGMEGYFRIARFVGNMCGIATSASYPVV